MPTKLSVMIGLKPSGLDEFIKEAQPVGIYSLNNRLDRNKYPAVKTIFRVQNDTWDRLPDACGVDRFFDPSNPNYQDPATSARHELLEKTIAMPHGIHLNLIDYWKLSKEDWYSPFGEYAIDAGPDAPKKAKWLNDWFMTALPIAHNAGLKLSMFGFATGNPDLAMLPYLYPCLMLAKQYGGIIDTHEYGVDGLLMESGKGSGALWYQKIHDALPLECRLDMVVSEFAAYSGMITDTKQMADAAAYGQAINKTPYLLWASAFQCDDGAENTISGPNFPPYTKVAKDNSVGTPPVIPPTARHYLKPTQGNLHVRDQASLKGAIVGTIPNGTKAEVESMPVLENNNVWYYCVKLHGYAAEKISVTTVTTLAELLIE